MERDKFPSMVDLIIVAVRTRDEGIGGSFEGAKAIADDENGGAKSSK
jgi:hypothetical protein